MWADVIWVSREEVVEVLKYLMRRGKGPDPDGILNKMVMYGGGGSEAAGDEFGVEESVPSSRLEEESTGAAP